MESLKSILWRLGENDPTIKKALEEVEKKKQKPRKRKPVIHL